jgi:hypothetical protein
MLPVWLFYISCITVRKVKTRAKVSVGYSEEEYVCEFSRIVARFMAKKEYELFDFT